MKGFHFFLFLILSKIIFAQDIHFSHFWDAMQFQNPSNIGNFDGTHRFTAIYRNQWNQFGTPLQTSYADWAFKKTYENQDYISGGIYVLQDKFDLLFYRQYRAMATFAYNKFLSEKINIAAGAQFGFKNTSINYDRLSFDRQWDPSTGGFEPWNPSFENYINENTVRPLLNLGVSANFMMGNVLNTLDVSLNHVNQPKDIYNASNSNIPIKYSINYHGYKPLSEDWMLMPKVSFLYTQNANAFLTGFLLKTKLNHFNELYGGAMYRWGVDRNSDAIVPVFGVKLNQFKLALSIDVTTSGLNQESQKGSLECTLVYILKPAQLRYFSVDCMRL